MTTTLHLGIPKCIQLLPSTAPTSTPTPVEGELSIIITNSGHPPNQTQPRECLFSTSDPIDQKLCRLHLAVNSMQFLAKPELGTPPAPACSLYLWQMAPKRPHIIKENILRKQLYWLNSYISIFSRFFIVFSIFQDTLMKSYISIFSQCFIFDSHPFISLKARTETKSTFWLCQLSNFNFNFNFC